jgi:hypothetical protein
VDLAVGRPIVPAHTGRGYRAESRTFGFRDKRCKLRGGAGEEDRPEANQIRREVAEAVERIVREPRVSRLSAPNSGAGEVFVQ